MLKALRRLRNSRGFGVHSPYGYRFVKSVIDPSGGYAYYAEDEIHSYLAKDPNRYKLRHEASTLLRIAAFTGVKSAWLPQKAHNVYRVALQGAYRSIRIESKQNLLRDVDLATTRGQMIPLDALSDFLKQGNRTLLISDIPSGWTESLFEAMPEGVLFEGKRNCIFLAKEGIRKVRYMMNL